VRDQVAKKKAGADRWLEIMEMAHQEGMKTSVTMMYGIGETLAERIEHLQRVREVQSRTSGFTAFICWPLQPENTPTMSHMPKTDAVEYLRTVAIARIVLDNVPNLQASWVTMGMKVGQTSLRFGCNTTHEIERLITDAGFKVARRRQDYSIIPGQGLVGHGLEEPRPAGSAAA
jgi:cyclic dehypoxanthinyl futalosine synthase